MHKKLTFMYVRSVIISVLFSLFADNAISPMYCQLLTLLLSDASEAATSSQANTLEMYQAPTITEDSKSYTTYERRSIEDYDDFYKPFDVSTLCLYSDCDVRVAEHV